MSPGEVRLLRGTKSSGYWFHVTRLGTVTIYSVDFKRYMVGQGPARFEDVFSLPVPAIRRHACRELPNPFGRIAFRKPFEFEFI